MRSALLLTLSCLLAGAPAAAEPASEPALALHAGIFDVGADEVGEVGFEVRLRGFDIPALPESFGLRPILGAMVTADESVYGFAGVRLEWAFAEAWVLAPHLSAGLYEEGDGKDLGGPVEFRSGIELAARVGERSQLGLMLYHLSNAVLYDKNPGEESLVLVWTRSF